MIEVIIEKTLRGNGDSDSHLATLFALCLNIKAKKILELGVRNGDTTLPFLCAAALTKGFVESVDINRTNFNCPSEYEKFWQFTQCDAIQYLENIKTNDPYDIIYIDDWHSYDHVKKELQIIDKIISPNSLVLLHDLMYANSQPFYHTDLTLKHGQWANGGPYRAVAELDTQFWEFSTIPACNGLTILRKKYSGLYWNK